MRTLYEGWVYVCVRTFRDLLSRTTLASPSAPPPDKPRVLNSRQRRLLTRLFMSLAFLVGLSTPPAFADVQYVYDELGRVVQVIDPSGASVQYTYDAAGNITSVRQLATTDLSITEFTPDKGPVGATVTIYGAGFSTTPSQNTVCPSGTPA